jgi:hypothetical protein
MSSKDLTWVKLGDDYRPAIFNYNVQDELERYFIDERDEAEARLHKAMNRVKERTGKESFSELTEEEKEEVFASQPTIGFTKVQVWACLKEGARKARQDFTVPDVVVEFDEEKGEPVEEVKGTRPVEPEDVGEWLEDAGDSDEIEKLFHMIKESKITKEQEKALEKHTARQGNLDEKKRPKNSS